MFCEVFFFFLEERELLFQLKLFVLHVEKVFMVQDPQNLLLFPLSYIRPLQREKGKEK